MLRSWFFAAAALSQIAAIGGAAAQDSYPSRAVTIIVPTGPGGPQDLTARSVGGVLSQKFGKPFVVESRPGAQGLVAMRSFAKAAPDGYTLFLLASSQAVLPALYELPYDPIKDITTIARLSATSATVVINNKIPANTFKEFVAYAKKHPSEITYPYQGGPTQLVSAMLAKSAGFEALGVPFRSSSQGLVELVAGRLSYMVLSPVQAKEQIDAGAIRVVATVDTKRAAAFPDIPTLEELGYPIHGSGWFGLIGPAGLPDEITKKLWTTIQEEYIGKDPQKELVKVGLDPVSDGPREFEAIFADDISRWKKFATELGIKPEKP